VPKVVTREQWGARAPRSITLVPWSRRTTFAVHYSAANRNQSVREIQNFHMDTRGWSDIGYNFLVDWHGIIYVGRGWDRLGAHIANHNTPCIGVCAIGTDADITIEQERSIRWLYDEATRHKGHPLTQKVHRDFAPTTCPGDRLAKWVHEGMQLPEGGPSPMTLDRADVDRIYEQLLPVPAQEPLPNGTALPATNHNAGTRLAYAHLHAFAARELAEDIYKATVSLQQLQERITEAVGRIASQVATLPPYSPEDLVSALVANPQALQTLANAIASHIPLIPSPQQYAEAVVQAFRSMIVNGG
jgi:N-acetylmuramoyl-L-alanine amidase-like protein